MPKKKKRGRPSVRSESAKKRIKLEYDKSRVALLEHHERFHSLMSAAGLSRGSDFVGVLLNCYETMKKEAMSVSFSPKPSTSTTPLTPAAAESTPFGKKLPPVDDTLSDITPESPSSDTSSVMVSDIADLPQSDKSPSQAEDSTKAFDDVQDSSTTKDKVDLSSTQVDVYVDEDLLNKAINLFEYGVEEPQTSTTESESPPYVDDPKHDPTWEPTEQDVDEYDDEDEDWEDNDEDIVVNVCPKGMGKEEMKALPLATEGDEIDDDAPEDGDDDTVITPDVTSTVKNAEEAVGPTFLCYEQNIEELIEMCPGKVCTRPGCTSKLESLKRKSGTALIITWICEKGHECSKWTSQPKLGQKGVFAGNFQLASNILLSGNNFGKIELLLKFLNMGCVSRTFFNLVQQNYAVSEISSMWEKELEKQWAARQTKKVIIAGDGRNDSPGHCANFCTYVTMDHDTHDILAMEVVDKRETGRNSVIMEREGFNRALKTLEDNGVEVVEVVTDAHIQITADLKKKPKITHQQDIWHGAKNLSKKLNKIAQASGNKELIVWQRDIITHFWYCCEKASKTDGDDLKKERVLKITWFGTLHHVLGEHNWKRGECDHVIEDEQRAATQEPASESAPKPAPVVTDQKPNLKRATKAHNALSDFVNDRNLLKKLKYYVHFRHTSELESFNNLILMYASKRFAFSPRIYRTRCQLAGLDYQYHKNRDQKRNAKGELRYNRVYSKKSATYSVRPVKVDKTYGYIRTLQLAIVSKKLADTKPFYRKVDRDENDPRDLGNLPPLPPPPTKELVQRHKSRIGLQFSNE